MNRSRAFMAAGALAFALAAGGTTIAVAGGGDDDGDEQTTGPAADKARAAALKANPGARANSVERDGENGATWEVELTRADGSTVDVRLAADYRIVVTEGDDESGDDD